MPPCPSHEECPEGGSSGQLIVAFCLRKLWVPLPGISSLGLRLNVLPVLEAGGTSSRGRTAHLFISLGRWLNSVTPEACFSLMLSERSCLERGSGSSRFEGCSSEWVRLEILPLEKRTVQ